MSNASARPPDTARLSHLQQLARGADRRLLIGSAALWPPWCWPCAVRTE